MTNPEGVILGMNAFILCCAYWVIYPRYCRANLMALALNDALSVIVALLIAGSMFGESGYRFNAFFTELGWFGFTLLTYFLMEIPFSMRYAKKYKLWDRFSL